MNELKTEIKQLEITIEELYNRKNKLIRELQSSCEHNNVLTSTNYESSGYDYPEMTTYSYVCKDCGYFWSEVITHKTYY